VLINHANLDLECPQEAQCVKDLVASLGHCCEVAEPLGGGAKWEIGH
jgi:hypothetical protein